MLIDTQMEKLRMDFVRIDIAEDQLTKHDARITNNVHKLVTFMDITNRVEKHGNQMEIVL